VICEAQHSSFKSATIGNAHVVTEDPFSLRPSALETCIKNSKWRQRLFAEGLLFQQVYAPTLPGYGRAEKPCLPYSQELWVAFLREFVVEVVRRPVVVVGNSIGGFLSASLAADYGSLVQGGVLKSSRTDIWFSSGKGAVRTANKA
jgi:pimeloyl-ACP methyl ester carboxylesterase